MVFSFGLDSWFFFGSGLLVFLRTPGLVFLRFGFCYPLTRVKMLRSAWIANRFDKHSFLSDERCLFPPFVLGHDPPFRNRPPSCTSPGSASETIPCTLSFSCTCNHCQAEPGDACLALSYCLLIITPSACHAGLDPASNCSLCMCCRFLAALEMTSKGVD